MVRVTSQRCRDTENLIKLLNIILFLHIANIRDSINPELYSKKFELDLER